MCVILACETEFPSLDTLKSCELMNSNGGGIGWKNENNEIFFEKGLTAKQIHHLIETNTVKLPCVIHFRISTVNDGMENMNKKQTELAEKSLTHPFIISKDSRLDLSGKLQEHEAGLLFHNGTVSDYNEILQRVLTKSSVKKFKGVYSDSRIMAFVSALYGHESLNLVTGWNKFCVLDEKGITKYGKWVDLEKGIQSSNDYFKASNQFYMGGYSYEDSLIDEYDYPCYGAKQNLVDGKYIQEDILSYSMIEIDSQLDSYRKESLNDENSKALALMFDKEAIERMRDSRKSNLNNKIENQVKAYSMSKKSKKRKHFVKFLESLGYENARNLSNKSLRKYVFREQKIIENQQKQKILRNELALCDSIHHENGISDYELKLIQRQNDRWVDEYINNSFYHSE